MGLVILLDSYYMSGQKKKKKKDALYIYGEQITYEDWVLWNTQ